MRTQRRLEGSAKVIVEQERPPEVLVETLLRTPSVTVRHLCCRGDCRGPGDEECAHATELVLPYRGVFTRSLGRDQAVAEANQALFFNADEGYRVSHPVAGGDACLSLAVDEGALRELAPRGLLRSGPGVAFHRQSLRIEPRAQGLAALLRRRLKRGLAEPLEAESLALALVGAALAPGARPAAASASRRKLADRVKLVLAGDLGRRWTLAEIAAETGGSPVYLTQVFRQTEGLPLYRYQLQLRLARALDLLNDHEDLTALALDLGFSSHSHFSAAFRKTYGCSPSAFRAASGRRNAKAQA